VLNRWINQKIHEEKGSDSEKSPLPMEPICTGNTKFTENRKKFPLKDLDETDK
jgi:hypothetical protein